MKQKPIMLSATALVAAFVLACNIEVGNPDTGDAPPSLMSSVNMRMTQYGDCGTGCNAVPVQSTASASLTMNLNTANLQLAQVALQPVSTQEIMTSVNLMQSFQVALSEAVNSSQLASVALLFSAKGTPESWVIGGRLAGTIYGQAIDIPVRLSGSGDISGSVSVPATGLAAIEFDPAVWFDFSSDTSIAQVLRSLEHGACTNTASRQCSEMQAVLSRLIENHIAKSMRSVANPAQAKIGVK